LKRDGIGIMMAGGKEGNMPELGRMIAQGRTAEVYEWGEGRVIKLLFDWCPPGWAADEAGKAERVFAAGMPAPRCLGTAEVDGRRGVVFERVQGVSMLRIMSGRPWRALQQARLMAELHADMHARAGEGFPRLRPFLEESIVEEDRLPDASRRRLLDLMDALPDGTALCHFDFHPDQIMITPNGPVILDWMGAFQGNAMADVARTLLLMKIGNVPYMGRVKRAAVDMLRDGISRVYLDRYARLNKAADRDGIWKWMVIVAAARLNERIEGEQEPLVAFLEASLRSADG
jgi:aminoglycoside phosphotransferase (APT) family kinase protein